MLQERTVIVNYEHMSLYIYDVFIMMYTSCSHMIYLSCIAFVQYFNSSNQFNFSFFYSLKSSRSSWNDNKCYTNNKYSNSDLTIREDSKRLSKGWVGAVFFHFWRLCSVLLDSVLLRPYDIYLIQIERHILIKIRTYLKFVTSVIWVQTGPLFRI